MYIYMLTPRMEVQHTVENGFEKGANKLRRSDRKGPHASSRKDGNLPRNVQLRRGSWMTVINSELTYQDTLIRTERYFYARKAP